MDTQWILVAGGLLIGAAFGAIVFLTNFCAMGGISDRVTFGDSKRLRAWLLAIAVAILGAQVLQAAGMVDLTLSLYLPPSLDWGGTLLGGFLFGYGMVFAGGCASKNLVRAGSGDLRALLTLLVLGLSAYAALGGILGPIRAAIARWSAIDLKPAGLATQSVATVLARGVGANAGPTQLVVGLVLAFGLIAYCLSDKAFRTSPRSLLSGFGVGACVSAGWALTGALYDELAIKPAPPGSLTFVRPSGDTMDWLMRFTAAPVPTFAVASVAGTLLGASLAALATRRFRIVSFADVADTRRHLFGAVLMGFGGIMATGCTMGQAVTGISTLATGSFLAFTGILAGGVWGVKALERSLGAEDFSI